MAEQKFKQRLDKIADTLPRNVLTGIDPMSFDKWICMSGMQKAIRRGDVALAGRLALSLWSQDKRSLWRRLAVIAAEDVALGDIETVLGVTAAAKYPAWRKTVGDAALGVHFAQRMAQVAKTRYLTEMYLYSEHARQATKARKWAATASFKELASILHDPAKEAPEQVLALFGLFGSRRFEAKNFKRADGDVEEAMKAVKKMPVPDEILSVSTATIGTPHFPLTMLLPIGCTRGGFARGVAGVFFVQRGLLRHAGRKAEDKGKGENGFERAHKKSPLKIKGQFIRRVTKKGLTGRIS